MTGAPNRDLDEPALRDWVGTRLPGDGPFEVSGVPGGNSNVMVAVARAGHRWVVRRPPPGASAATHDPVREMTVLAAIRDSAVPHARLVLGCTDPTVLGSPFAVLEWIDGICPHVTLPVDVTRAGVAELARDLVAVLADLHRVPVTTGGLADLGRPEGFCVRQSRRWSAALPRERALPELERALELLARDVPAEHPGALVHGDYMLHNILIAGRPPLRVRAVVDWETATVGHPLLDLGHLLTFWPGGPDPTPWRVGLPPVPVGLYPDRRFLLDAYQAAAGPVEVDDVPWFCGLAALRMAVILEGTYRRGLAAARTDRFVDELHDVVPYLGRLGLEFLEGGADRIGIMGGAG